MANGGKSWPKSDIGWKGGFISQIAMKVRVYPSSGWINFLARDCRRKKEPAKRLFLNGDGRREWDRTTDHHHVKVVLYH